MIVRKPNFFIVGAPKCGTTALSLYLSEHPSIFFCNPKEPHFFASDFDGHRPIRDLDAYLNLFQGANDQQLAVGEGSVLYLYSEVALSNIRSFAPAAKIIVMLRNPLDFVQSLHQQYLHALYDDVADFRTAWSMQDERAVGRHVPRLCRQPELLLYGKMGKFAWQIERLFSIFPRAQVQVILFDDFVSDPSLVYREALQFLEVPDDGRSVFPKVNEAQVLRPGMAAKLARNTPVRLRNLITRMRFIPVLSGIPGLAERLLKIPGSRPKPDEDLLAELHDYFDDDVEKLSRLIGRPLSHWIRTTHP